MGDPLQHPPPSFLVRPATAGRIENAQVAVYLVYAGGRGHAMIDRELYQAADLIALSCNDPAAVHHVDPEPARTLVCPGLVNMATPPPAPRPTQPLRDSKPNITADNDLRLEY